MGAFNTGFETINLHRPTRRFSTSRIAPGELWCCTWRRAVRASALRRRRAASTARASVWRRRLNVKAKVESGSSHFSVKRLFPASRRFQQGFHRVKLQRPTLGRASSTSDAAGSWMCRRKFILQAKLETS
jgi:hypothetical protein